jgi:energy-coupling factor transport system ATP-binding protein
MISFRHVSYHYPEAGRAVLDGLSLDVPDGAFVLVIGPSGSGKSTFLRCLNGLVPHFSGGVIAGQIRVNGRDPVAMGPRGMSELVGFVNQDPEAQFVTEQVEDELAFAMENFGLPPLLMRKRIEEVLDLLSIAHLRDRRVSTLSGGEQQRVAIAAAMTLQPRVLVLDEPTSQLDPQAAEEVLTALQKLNDDLGLTVIVAEHRLERVLGYADRVLYLPGAGRPVLYGEPREVMAQAELAPPLVELGRRLGWQPLPLTLKEARQLGQVEGCRLKVESSRQDRPNLQPSTSNLQPVVEVRDLWFAYNGHPALCGINLTIQPGELVAVMGRNGSGKTTLLKHLVGLLRPGGGRVALFGQDIRGQETADLARRVGLVPQNLNALLFADTVRDELAFTRRAHGLPPGDDRLLDLFGLAHLADAYPRDLSVGERQRVALGAILAGEPDLLLLDEPTRGLDYFQKRALVRFLRGQQAAGRTIILATHDVELVAGGADRVVILGEGEVIVDGPTRQVMTGSLVFASQVNKLYRDPRVLTVEDVVLA